MRYESKRRPRGGKGGRETNKSRDTFFLSSCEFVKESKNDFLSSRRVCDSPAMNSDELCAVMNPRHEKHFREHEHYSPCSRSPSFRAVFSYLCLRETQPRRSFGKYFRAIRSTLRAARLPGDRRHSRGYNFIAGDRIGRRCIRPTGVNPLRGESQQDEEGNGVGEEE